MLRLPNLELSKRRVNDPLGPPEAVDDEAEVAEEADDPDRAERLMLARPVSRKSAPHRPQLCLLPIFLSVLMMMVCPRSLKDLTSPRPMLSESETADPRALVS